LSFPSNPADNATTLINGVNYIYSSANASWSPITSTNTLTYSSITATTSAITGTETVGTSVVTGSESVGGNETVTGNQLVLGNIGVGTITPSYKVHVVGTAGSGLISFGSTGTTTAYNEAFVSNTGGSTYWGVESSAGGGIFTGSSAYAGVFGTGSSTPVQIATGNTVKMTVDSSGNVGIGTTSPPQKLTVTNGNFELQNVEPYFIFKETDQGTDGKLWDNFVGNGTMNYRAVNDAYNAATPWLQVNRTGITINTVSFPSGNVGIGSSSPEAQVTISHPTAPTLYISETGGTGVATLFLKQYGTISEGLKLTYDSGTGHSYINNIYSGGNLYFQTVSTTRMTIDSSGRVSTPSQPAFFAYCPTIGDYTEGNLVDLPFNTTAFNIGTAGGHFNTANYRFTAPVAGVYHFSYNLFNNGGSGRVSFKLNGSSYYNTQNQSTSGGQFMNESKTMYLNANDYVTVGDWQSISGKLIYMGHSSFSGFFVG
jgi:hypothetical protein